MPFAYYEHLSARDRATYRASDEVRALRIFRPAELAPQVEAVRRALERGEPEPLRAAADRLAFCITERLRVPKVELAVFDSRPRGPGAELHGLYTRLDDRALIRVWMRTAVHGRVVAFRTFLRTLLHELCHHLDAELLKLPTSFHTEGFYKRETSLFHQLVPPPPKGRARPF